MNVILCILLIGAVILLFFILCAFGLQAARAAFPTYQIPPTTYSYQIDRQHGDMERFVAKATPASGNPQQQIWVLEVDKGRVGSCNAAAYSPRPRIRDN